MTRKSVILAFFLLFTAIVLFLYHVRNEPIGVANLIIGSSMVFSWIVGISILCSYLNRDYNSPATAIVVAAIGVFVGLLGALQLA